MLKKFSSFKQFIRATFAAILICCTVSVCVAGGTTTGDGPPDVGSMIMDHIADGHEYHLFGDVSIPLPCITYDAERGLNFFMSSKFHHGHDSYKGFVLNHGRLMNVNDPSFPKDKVVHLKGFTERDKQKYVIDENGKEYPVSRSGFFDFSITRVVFTMLLAVLIMFIIFTSIARAYSKRDVPKGMQSFFEPIILFIRDDVAKPNLGDKYEKYMPFLLSVFFFIWICNLLGLIPFFPGSGNVMGNINVTFTLAVFTFILIMLGSNRHYWSHILWPPGVPFLVKIILIVIEVASVFIKPAALMIRLFANITAGHIIILSFVGIIFIIYHVAGTAGGIFASILSVAFMLFMNALELFVAILQAYIFTILSAIFIGEAVNAHGHHDHDHDHEHGEAHAH